MGGGGGVWLYSEWAILFNFFVFLKSVKIFYCRLTTLNVSLSSTEKYIFWIYYDYYYEFIMIEND